MLQLVMIYAGQGMGGATTGDGGHAQCETGCGDGDGGDAGMLGEVSGANTATSTLVYISTIFKTNTPFLVSSNFIHTCLLAIQQCVSWSHLLHVLKPSHVQTHPLHCK